MREAVGTVYDQTTTSEFIAMLNTQAGDEKLKFSYMEVHPDDKYSSRQEVVIARIKDIRKENPLLSRDQAELLSRRLQNRL